MSLEKIAVLILTAVIATLLGVAIWSSDDRDVQSDATDSPREGVRAEKTLDDLRRYAGGRKRRRVEFDDDAGGRPRPKPDVAGPRVTTEPKPGTSGTARSVTVRPGDTLYDIAVREFGRADLTDEIVAANPGLNPLKLRVGTKIRLPDVDRVASGRGARGGEKPVNSKHADRRHVVRRAETLSGIAKRYYGKASMWRLIYEANRTQLPRPEALKPNMVLVVPEPPARD